MKQVRESEMEKTESAFESDSSSLRTPGDVKKATRAKTQHRGVPLVALAFAVPPPPPRRLGLNPFLKRLSFARPSPSSFCPPPAIKSMSNSFANSYTP